MALTNRWADQRRVTVTSTLEVYVSYPWPHTALEDRLSQRAKELGGRLTGAGTFEAGRRLTYTFIDAIKGHEFARYAGRERAE